MIIGIPKEVKTNENRVAVTPDGVAKLVAAGHTVYVEINAGWDSNFSDASYFRAGATILMCADVIWAMSDMIVKVKEPIESEWKYIRPGQIIFTYFHLAASERLTRALINSGAVCIAYETVELPSGELPLLKPMSEVAGRMAAQEGAKYLGKLYGGRGILLSGTSNTPPAKVLVIGGGVAGTNAALVAAGMGADVVILEVSSTRINELKKIMPSNVTVMVSGREFILYHIADADLIIGAVLLHGASAPKVIRAEDLSRMKKGAVIVDISIDQGGCVETMLPTTHEHPTFTVEGIVHYGVANMPGAFPLTSTLALTNATLPYVLEIANKGWEQALKDSPALAKGLNIADGKITYEKVAEAFKYWNIMTEKNKHAKS